MEFVERDLTELIIGACLIVSNELGAGFLESVYEKALLIALRERGLDVSPQHQIPVSFHGQCVGQFYADILVEGRVIIEIKATNSSTAVHEAQLINYLKATGIKVGLLINFGRPRLDWKRIVN